MASFLTRPHANLLSLTYCNRYFLFQTKRHTINLKSLKLIPQKFQHATIKQSTYSYTSKAEDFRLASFRVLNSNLSKDPIATNMNFVRRQTTAATNPPANPPENPPTNPPKPAENLPKKVRSKPKSSSVDTLSPEAKRAVKIVSFTSVILGIGFIIYSGELYFSLIFLHSLTRHYK